MTALRSESNAGDDRPVPSELEIVKARLDRLQRLGRGLNAATTVQDVIDVVVAGVDGSIHQSSSRGMWIHEPGADHLRVAGLSGMPDGTLDRFARIPLSSDLPGAVAHRERRTVVSDSRTQAERDFDDLRGVARSTEGFVAMPLLFERTSLGVIGLGYDVELDDDDVAFLESVARQAAQALIRVRLAERDNRRRIELEFLADLTDAALTARSHEELMENVTTAAVPMLGDWCSLYFLPEDDPVPQVTMAHVRPDRAAWVQELLRRYPFDPSSDRGVAAVIRSGETAFIPLVTPMVIDEALAAIDHGDELRPILEDLTSVITVPLLTKRRVVGAMQFASAESGRVYDEDDVSLAEAVAGRLAEALDSAWIADRDRNIVVTLQRALLPPRLPVIEGIDLAAKYWPAGGVGVGGDFYDIFAVSSDRWCVVIGDACGTGPNAAALTSIARHTVRAAARHDAPHDEVVDWVNEAVLLSDRDLFCTACYSTLDRRPGGWHLTSVSAGHPLPIVVNADGARLVGSPGRLLGVFPDARSRPVECELGPGDVLVFYTDGVTDLPPPHGLSTEEMLELVAGLRDRPSALAIAHGIHRSVLDRVPESSRRDDIAVVVLRVGDAR